MMLDVLTLFILLFGVIGTCVWFGLLLWYLYSHVIYPLAFAVSYVIFAIKATKEWGEETLCASLIRRQFKKAYITAVRGNRLVVRPEYRHMIEWNGIFNWKVKKNEKRNKNLQDKRENP